MKKYVIVALSLLLCVGVLVGCTPEISRLDAMKGEVSYMQDGLMVGGNEAIKCEVASGSREISMISDGVASEMMDFCTLTITPLDYELYNKQFSYKLIGDKGEVSGDCKKAIIGINQVADIMDLAALGNITKIVVTYDEVVIEIDLANAIEGMIDYNVAIESVFDGCMTELEPMYDENKFMAEVHAKITCDNNSTDTAKYYWYISVVESTDSSLHVLIDGASGDILAKKCNTTE